MKLYLVFGETGEMDSEGMEVRLFYGAFSTEEKANELCEKLKAAQWEDEQDEYLIDVCELDQLTELAEFMLETT